MAANKLTIKLTEDQQKQIRDATGKSITELTLDADELAEKELDQVAGAGTAQYSIGQVKAP